MADNYLEKKMDDYRRGVTRRSAAAPRRGWAVLRYAPLTVVLDRLGPAVARAMALAFHGAACRVACVAETDPCEGCGARFYPLAGGFPAMLADMSGRSETPDVVISGAVPAMGGNVPPQARVIYMAAGDVPAIPAGASALVGTNVRAAVLAALALADRDAAFPPQTILIG